MARTSAVKVGIIGYGGSARIYHLPYILPVKDLEVYAFLQRAAAPESSEKPGNHCTIDFPEAKHYRNEEDFFADEVIELVIVCTHTDTHASFAEKALNAGKHGECLVNYLNRIDAISGGREALHKDERGSGQADRISQRKREGIDGVPEWVICTELGETKSSR
jgi:hypothetical protein